MSVTANRVDRAGPAVSSLREDVLTGLSGPGKSLSPKYFYDAEGARLFDAICRTPEYYITRTEERMLRELAGDMARCVGTGGLLIEPGAGNARKVRLLLEAIRPAMYMPVEICKSYLDRAVRELMEEHPWLNIRAARADFTLLDSLPYAPRDLQRLMFFPGSTIGNFEPTAAVALLRRMARLVGPGGMLLVGVDLKKSPDRLEAAYNDAAGHTAAFNRNLLVRINRELNADFEPESFHHWAFYNAEQGRIEMHLISDCEQTVRIDGAVIHFRKGESIHTENSYKYTPGEFRRLAGEGGLRPLATWSDPDGLFSIHALKA
jgi:dimethylhistidine N-methyltransferase